jgi:hypothetical protein
MIGTLLLASTLFAATADVAFAFSNASGTRLLAVGEVAEPARLTRATCDGRIVETSFLAQQPAGAKDSGRQTSSNFRDAPGALYEVKGALAPGDASCLLASSAFLATHPPVAVPRREKKCSDKVSALAARAGGRAVDRCLEVGTFPGGTLALVTYARKGDELLVGLVLFTEKVTALRRLPAKFEKDAPSCWRADDGCVFDPAAYRVPFVLTGVAEPMIFELWDGPEGQNLELMRPKGEDLEAVASGYRYWAPD